MKPMGIRSEREFLEKLGLVQLSPSETVFSLVMSFIPYSPNGKEEEEPCTSHVYLVCKLIISHSKMGYVRVGFFLRQPAQDICYYKVFESQGYLLERIENYFQTWVQKKLSPLLMISSPEKIPPNYNTDLQFFPRRAHFPIYSSPTIGTYQDTYNNLLIRIFNSPDKETTVIIGKSFPIMKKLKSGFFTTASKVEEETIIAFTVSQPRKIKIGEKTAFFLETDVYFNQDFDKGVRGLVLFGLVPWKRSEIISMVENQQNVLESILPEEGNIYMITDLLLWGKMENLRRKIKFYHHQKFIGISQR